MPDASPDMIMMVMMMNINNQLYVLRSHKCHSDPASTQEDESKQDGVWGVDCPHVGRMVSRSSSEDDNVFGIKCLRYIWDQVLKIYIFGIKCFICAQVRAP